MLGDGCQIGCNAVLSPGSIVGRGAVIYPNVFWRGVLPEKMIVKESSPATLVPRRIREAQPGT
jgi:acetyltransferase-like isoleucine patch superfamily enzyme